MIGAHVNYSEIKYLDTANGIGVRTSLFVSGCMHRCHGCFNESTWRFDAGKKFTSTTEGEIMSSLSLDYVDGLSVLGGEPLEPENQPCISELLLRVKSEFPEKSVWMWTGFTWEQLWEYTCRANTPFLRGILGCVDVLVDGEFVESKKQLLLRFRGSSNQRLVDVPESLKCGNVVPWEDCEVFSSHGW